MIGIAYVMYTMCSSKPLHGASFFRKIYNVYYRKLWRYLTMLTNSTIAVIVGILVFGFYAAAVTWTIYNIKKAEVKK